MATVPLEDETLDRLTGFYLRGDERWEIRRVADHLRLLAPGPIEADLYPVSEHEFFVATFYLKRDKPRAAALRLEGLLERFPSSGYEGRAKFLLGKCFLLMADVPRAVAIWEDLIAKFPNHALSTTAADYIREFRLSGVRHGAATTADPDTDVVVDAGLE